MKFETKYFGTVEVPPDEVITFPNGLFGFEEERSFLLLPFAGSDGNMLCLQSAATPSLAFIAMNPFSLLPAISRCSLLRNCVRWRSRTAMPCAIMFSALSGSLCRRAL